MPRDLLKRARRFGWLHLAVRITMGLDELKSPERGLWHMICGRSPFLAGRPSDLSNCERLTLE